MCEGILDALKRTRLTSAVDGWRYCEADFITSPWAGLTLQGVDSWSAVIQLIEGQPSGLHRRVIKCYRLYFDFTLLLHLSELDAYVTNSTLARTEPGLRERVTALKY